MPSCRVLVLGGSSEASALVRILARRPDIEAILSLAGRTVDPPSAPVSTRVGGFGGGRGLATYCERERIDVLVDATHPFAATMSGNAWSASQRTGVPLVRLTRPPWRAEAGDLWREVDDMAAAVRALPATPQRVLLTIGRLQLAAFAKAPQHRYVARTIDPPTDHGLADATFVAARGPFDTAAEDRLMRDHRIDVVVTKNSGGAAAAAKLAAARHLGIPVILVRRPDEPGPAIYDVAEALAAIEAHRSTRTPRGV